MDEILMAIFIFVLAPALILLISVAGNFRLARFLGVLQACLLRKGASTEKSDCPAGEGIFSRVRFRQAANSDSAAFVVEICGTVSSSSDTQRAAVKIWLNDVTEGTLGARPVYTILKQWQEQDSPAFVYSAQLGRLPSRQTILSDWTSVGQIQLDWLVFPRVGKRNLLFNISVVSCETGREIAFTQCGRSYENFEPGYIDIYQNTQRAKMLAVPLAFAVSAADRKIYDCEVQIIKNWARNNIDISDGSDKAAAKLERALDNTLEFFREGNQLDNCEICREIAELTPLAERCDVLELCLRVARANGTVSKDETDFLKEIAGWLEVDMNRFRDMMEKILPVGMHECSDAQAILGVTADMDKEKTRQLLNQEYRKWNARVTSADPAVQSQADQMLKLIAEARREYVASNT